MLKEEIKLMKLLLMMKIKVILKKLLTLDITRLGFKPEEGQNQWTSSCQNSGNDKKRRLIIISSNDLKELSRRGYKFNSNTGYYEKNADAVIKGKNYNTTVRAVKLANDDGTFNYYTCDPSDNNEHMFIGFLSKSNNPNDLLYAMYVSTKRSNEVSDNKAKKIIIQMYWGYKKDNNIEASATKDIEILYSETSKK